MPITTADIKFFLSGGASNTDGDASLGGAISTTQASSTANELFDIVTGNEASAGSTEYRCIYVKNDNATLTLFTTRVFIETNTPSTDTTVEIALGTSSINGTEQTIANETTAPSGTSFSTAANEGAALTIGDIPAGEHKAIWIKRIVSASASAYDADGVTIRIKGDTGE